MLEMNGWIRTTLPLAAWLLTCGCKTGTTLEVRGTFDDLWSAAYTVTTNKGFTILSEDVPDFRIGRNWGLIEARRAVEDVGTQKGAKEVLTHREPWDQIRFAVSPIEPKTNVLTRRVKVTASTEKTDLMILSGRKKILPNVQAEMVEAFLEQLTEDASEPGSGGR